MYAYVKIRRSFCLVELFRFTLRSTRAANAFIEKPTHKFGFESTDNALLLSLIIKTVHS